MANPNLRTFLAEAEAAGEVVRIKKHLDPKFQVSAVLAKLEAEEKYPACLFEDIGSGAYPVVSNLFASRKRLALSLGCTDAELNAVYREREDKRIEPVMVESAPVQEIVLQGEDVDLYQLPILTHNALDAGPYVTCGASVTKDPDTGIRNIGVYRHQLHGKNKLGIHMSEASHVNYIYGKYEARGEDMPIAITLGHHPAFYLGCLSFVPVGVDEYGVAGALMGQPLELVKCKSCDLEVPAEAEIVLEGYVSATERQMEAPFGEFTTMW